MLPPGARILSVKTCCQESYLGLWSCSWSLCWCLWSMSLQGGGAQEIRGLCWAGLPFKALEKLALLFTGWCSKRTGPNPDGRPGPNTQERWPHLIPWEREDWHWWHGHTVPHLKGAVSVTWTNQLHYHPGPQVDLVLALPNMYPMQYLLEFLKELVMWNNTGGSPWLGIFLG